MNIEIIISLVGSFAAVAVAVVYTRAALRKDDSLAAKTYAEATITTGKLNQEQAAQITYLMSRNHEFDLKLAEADILIEKMRAAKEAAEKLQREAEKEKEAWRDRNDGLIKRVVVLQQNYDALHASNDAMRTRIKDQDTRMASQDSRIMEQDERINALQTKNTALQKRVEEQETEIRKLSEENAQLRQKLNMPARTLAKR